MKDPELSKKFTKPGVMDIASSVVSSKIRKAF
jgi:hypothetical protein